MSSIRTDIAVSPCEALAAPRAHRTLRHRPLTPILLLLALLAPPPPPPPPPRTPPRAARHRARHGRHRHAPPGRRRRHDGPGRQLGLFPARHDLQLQLLDRARPRHRGGARPRDVAPQGDGGQRDPHLRRDHAEVGAAHLRTLRDLHDPEPRAGPLRGHGRGRLLREHGLLGPPRPRRTHGRGRGAGERIQGHARRPHVAARQREQLRAGVEFGRDRGPA